MPQEQRIEYFQNIVSAHFGAYDNSQGLPRKLIQHREHLVAPTVTEFVVNEVDGPDMVRMGWSAPNDRAVFVIEPLAFLVSLRKLQPFLAPEPLDFLVIDPPALDVKQLCDLAIAKPTVPLCQPDDCQLQCIVISRCRPILQGAPRQANHPASPPLGRRELLAGMNDGLTELLCSQALGFR